MFTSLWYVDGCVVGIDVEQLWLDPDGVSASMSVLHNWTCYECASDERMQKTRAVKSNMNDHRLTSCQLDVHTTLDTFSLHLGWCLWLLLTTMKLTLIFFFWWKIVNCVIGWSSCVSFVVGEQFVECQHKQFPWASAVERDKCERPPQEVRAPRDAAANKIKPIAVRATRGARERVFIFYPRARECLVRRSYLWVIEIYFTSPCGCLIVGTIFFCIKNAQAQTTFRKLEWTKRIEISESHITHSRRR